MAAIKSPFESQLIGSWRSNECATGVVQAGSDPEKKQWARAAQAVEDEEEEEEEAE